MTIFCRQHSSVFHLDPILSALLYFNPANRFDAEGLTALIRVVEDRRKLRNEIEQQSVVSIRERNLEAERETLALDRESELAR